MPCTWVKPFPTSRALSRSQLPSPSFFTSYTHFDAMIFAPGGGSCSSQVPFFSCRAISTSMAAVHRVESSLMASVNVLGTYKRSGLYDIKVCTMWSSSSVLRLTTGSQATYAVGCAFSPGKRAAHGSRLKRAAAMSCSDSRDSAARVVVVMCRPERRGGARGAVESGGNAVTGTVLGLGEGERNVGANVVLSAGKLEFAP